jgi:tetratricopeptide (TPR) repeat protein
MWRRVAPLHYRLGRCLVWWGCNWAAAWAFDDATRADPTLFDAHLWRGEALARRRHWHEASRAYREAARLRPTDVDVQGSLAFALGRAGRWDDAVMALRRLAHLRPLQAEVHVLIAAIQRLKLRRPDESIRAYRWAVRLELPPAGIRFQLAEAILGAATWDSALDAFRQAKGVEPVAESRSEEPGRSVLHQHPGGPVAVPLLPRPTPSALPSSLRALMRGWQRVGEGAQAAQNRVGKAVRVLAGAASAAERAALLHCYHKAPATEESVRRTTRHRSVTVEQAGHRAAQPRPIAPARPTSKIQSSQRRSSPPAARRLA